jgi:general stress protein YciG
VGAERTVGAERAIRPERSIRAERVRTMPVGRAGGRALPGGLRARRAGVGSRPRGPALAGLRLLGCGGLVEPVGGHDPEERSDADRTQEGGRRGGKAMSSVHDRSEVEADGGPGDLSDRTA